MTRQTAPTAVGLHTAPAQLPSLLPGDLEAELAAAVAAALHDRAGWSRVLARSESEQPTDMDLWRILAAELGVAGLAVPEPHGSGASWVETSVIAETLGAGLAPVPFLGSASLATAALMAIPEPDWALLAALTEGSRVGTVAISLTRSPYDSWPTAMRFDGTLSGRVTSVPDASSCDFLICPALEGTTPVLLYVPAEMVEISPIAALDMTRPLADVTARSSAGTTGLRVLARGSAAEAALRFAVTAGVVMLACEQVGLAEACLTQTVAYSKQRYQFARPIGSYQALKHRMADLWAELTRGRAAARYAAVCLATSSPDLPVASALAATICSDLAVHAAEECLQLHGGIGFTWEHPAHLYLKRAKSDSLALGSPDAHRAELGSLVGLESPAV